MSAEWIVPDWRSPPAVRALVTTRAAGDMRAGARGRNRLRALLPSEPLWLRQVHGIAVVEASRALQAGSEPEADAVVTRARNSVCAVLVADCMPVLLASEAGDVIGLAHAGWRGLASGVLEATLEAMRAAPARMSAWLGPAIGPRVYEVGDEVRAVFLEQDRAAHASFAPARPGHWLLDLYAEARRRLERKGVVRIAGGSFCTFTDRERFFSHRRDRARERMAALAWIE